MKNHIYAIYIIKQNINFNLKDDIIKSVGESINYVDAK
jgi:hypothetical protein